MVVVPIPLGLLAAVAVAALSAYATLVGSRRRFRADVLSANRQKWIDTFRDRLSELVSLMNSAQVIKRMTTSGWRGGDQGEMSACCQQIVTLGRAITARSGAG